MSNSTETSVTSNDLNDVKNSVQNSSRTTRAASRWFHCKVKPLCLANCTTFHVYVSSCTWDKEKKIVPSWSCYFDIYMHGLLLSLSINLSQSAFSLKIMHHRKKISSSWSNHLYGQYSHFKIMKNHSFIVKWYYTQLFPNVCILLTGC